MRCRYLAAVVLLAAVTAPLAAIAAPGSGTLIIAESKSTRLLDLVGTQYVSAESVLPSLDLGKLDVLAPVHPALVRASSSTPAMARSVDVAERKPAAFHLRL